MRACRCKHEAGGRHQPDVLVATLAGWQRTDRQDVAALVKALQLGLRLAAMPRRRQLQAVHQVRVAASALLVSANLVHAGAQDARARLRVLAARLGLVRLRAQAGGQLLLAVAHGVDKGVEALVLAGVGQPLLAHDDEAVLAHPGGRAQDHLEPLHVLDAMHLLCRHLGPAGMHTASGACASRMERSC